VLAFLDRGLAGRHLGHSNPHETHQTDLGVIRFDKDDRTGSDDRDVFLTRALSILVRRMFRGKVFKERFREVGAVDYVRLFDGAGYRSVPSMVRQGGEEGLVNGSPDKLLGQRVLREHIDDRIRLSLDPELVPGLDIMGDLVRLALATVGDDIIVLRLGNRSDTLVETEETGEEIVPTLVPVVLSLGVALEELFERFVRSADVGDLQDTLLAALPKPTLLVGSQHLGRVGRSQELVPYAQDLFQHGVDFRVLEDGEPGSGSHGPIEQGVDRDTDETDRMASIGP